MEYGIRDCVICVKVTKAERDNWMKMSRSRGISMSDIVRMILSEQYEDYLIKQRNIK
jgi:peptide subunit release factor RF-3